MPLCAFAATSASITNLALRGGARRTQHCLCTMSSGPEERFDVLNDNGTHAGFSKLRPLVHRDGDLHRSTHIWVLSREGQVLLQKRSRDKDTFPGKWDVSAAGHITAGDESRESAARELEEELGISLSSPDELQFVCEVRASATGETEKHGKFVDNEIQDIYAFFPEVTIPVEGFRLQVEEVEKVEYWDVAAYRAALDAGDARFVPRCPDYDTVFFPWLETAFQVAASRSNK